MLQIIAYISLTPPVFLVQEYCFYISIVQGALTSLGIPIWWCDLKTAHPKRHLIVANLGKRYPYGPYGMSQLGSIFDLKNRLWLNQKYAILQIRVPEDFAETQDQRTTKFLNPKHETRNLTLSGCFSCHLSLHLNTNFLLSWTSRTCNFVERGCCSMPSDCSHARALSQPHLFKPDERLFKRL